MNYFIDLLEDLRFFIGSFFFIIGALLVIKGIVDPISTEGFDLNLITGVCFFAFSCVLLALAILQTNRMRQTKGQKIGGRR